MALDQAGNAVSVWGTDSSGVHAAMRPAVTGTWQAPTTLSAPGGSVGEAQVAIGPTGLAITAWNESNATGYVVRAASALPGGPFGAPVDVSTRGSLARVPQLAIAGTVAVVAWERESASNSLYVQAAARPAASGVWQPQVDLTAPTQNTDQPQVALDSAGDAVAVWERVSDADTVVQAASRPISSGIWTAPINVSIPMTTLVPDVTGFTKRSAATQVTAAGLVPQFTGAITATTSYVATETPAPGTLVPRGTTVTLFLKQGIAP